MSKIICEICGTTYPDTAECCPICGCSRDMAAEFAKEDLSFEAAPFRPAGKKKEIFDFDEVNGLGAEDTDTEDVYAYTEEEEEEEGGSQHNTFLVVLLTVLIVVLLALTGFLFVKFFLPNIPKETEPATLPMQTTQAPTTMATETTELYIPCQSLALSSGNAELTHEGMQFLLNVVVSPENTTDTVVYTSEDESIATVDAGGRITAVAQGETVVTITCGDRQITCPVICRFEEDNGETIPETVEETTEATTVETVDPSITLKLKKNDIMLPVFTYFTLELDCKLEQTDVEWVSAHPYIATVDEKGVVTAMKAGTTEITAKYGDQEVKCIVRCY